MLVVGGFFFKSLETWPGRWKGATFGKRANFLLSLSGKLDKIYVVEHFKFVFCLGVRDK